jgi:hypothetical protein
MIMLYQNYRRQIVLSSRQDILFVSIYIVFYNSVADLDPHQRERKDPDPTHESKAGSGTGSASKSNPKSCGWRLETEPWRAEDANNGGVEAQNRAVKGL